MTERTPAALELVEISHHYGRGRRRRRVLDGVDLVLGRGEVVGLIGPNGAGKSTLLHIAAGLLRPEAGRVFLGGDELSRSLSLAGRARRGLGFLPQTPSIFRELTVRENLYAVHGAAASQVDAAAEWASLTSLLPRLAGELSGGERRRVELARLQILDPKVWVCDEPFTGLDPHGVNEVTKLLSQRAEMGEAVLVTDHRVGWLAPICSRLIVLVDGAVIRDAETQMVLDDEQIRQMYLGVGIDV